MMSQLRSAIRLTAVLRLGAGLVMIGLGVLMFRGELDVGGPVLGRVHGVLFPLIGLALVTSGARSVRVAHTRLVRALERDPSQIGWAYLQPMPLGGQLLVVRFRDGAWTSIHVGKRRGAELLEAIAERAPGVVAPFSPEKLRAYHEQLRAWKRDAAASR